MENPINSTLVTTALAADATPDTPDRMPAETALSILTDRLGRHSSAFKRTAREARENYINLPKSPKHPLMRLRVKLANLSIVQLNKVVNRSRKHAIRLRMAIQRVPETMKEYRSPLAAKLAWVEMVLKFGHLEAAHRKAICQNYPMARTGLTTYEDEVKKYGAPANENPTPAV